MPPRSTPDPIALLNSLTAADVEKRLSELDSEAKALRSLLRSLNARERARADSSRRRAGLNPRSGASNAR